MYYNFSTSSIQVHKLNIVIKCKITQDSLHSINKYSLILTIKVTKVTRSKAVSSRCISKMLNIVKVLFFFKSKTRLDSYDGVLVPHKKK